MATKYEYRVVHFGLKWKTLGTELTTDFDAIETEMNVLGAEGWELVKVSEAIAANTTVALIAMFKRAAG